MLANKPVLAWSLSARLAALVLLIGASFLTRGAVGQPPLRPIPAAPAPASGAAKPGDGAAGVQRNPFFEKRSPAGAAAEANTTATGGAPWRGPTAPRATLPPGAVPLAPPPSEKPAAQGTVNGPSPEEVARRVKQVEDAAELDEPTKAEALKRLAKARDCANLALAALAKAAEFQKQTQEAPEALANIKRQHAAEMPEPKPEVAPDATLVQLEQALSKAEADSKDARAELAKREAEIKLRDRKTEILKLSTEAAKTLEETRKQLAVGPPAGEPPLLTLAKRTELETRQASLESQLVAWKAEAQALDAMVELAPLRETSRSGKSFGMTSW